MPGCPQAAYASVYSITYLICVRPLPTMGLLWAGAAKASLVSPVTFLRAVCRAGERCTVLRPVDLTTALDVPHRDVLRRNSQQSGASACVLEGGKREGLGRASLLLGLT